MAAKIDGRLFVTSLELKGPVYYSHLHLTLGERTGLVVRTSDSGSGDPGSILGRVGVLFP